MKIAVCISGLIGYTKKLGQGKIIDFHKTKEKFQKTTNLLNIHHWHLIN